METEKKGEYLNRYQVYTLRLCSFGVNGMKEDWNEFCTQNGVDQIKCI